MSAKTTGKKRGRPAVGGPVIAGIRNGAGIGWCDGQFAGDAEIVRDARTAITDGRRIWLGRAVQAGATTPAEATAALLAAGVTVQQAPDDLLSLATGWQDRESTNATTGQPSRAQRLAALSETHYAWSLRQDTNAVADETEEPDTEDADEQVSWQPLVADDPAAEDEFLTEARRVLDSN